MESGKRIFLQEIKEMDMVSYLAGLGIEPVKIRGNDFWYLSPFRDEKTPSFKINRRKNFWIDFGAQSSTGKFNGGNIIDFALQYADCTIGELLASFSLPSFLPQKHKEISNLLEETEPKIRVVSSHTLSATALLNYLASRLISMPIADHFCKEVKFEIAQKIYYGIGFKNNSQGWEIRNAYAKYSCAPKDITTIDNGMDEVIVFEGFMDFLSFLTINPSEAKLQYDFVILNGITLFERARRFMENHKAIRLYLDRDKTGRAFKLYACSLSNRYLDESHLYHNYKDYNDWLINAGKHPSSSA